MADSRPLQPLDQTVGLGCAVSSPTESSTSSPKVVDAATQPTSTEMQERNYPDRSFFRKPILPYAQGYTITAWQHEPPEPSGSRYRTEAVPVRKDWESLSQLEYCLAEPPPEGDMRCKEPRTFTITSTIRTGRDCGAQLVIVDDTMVAKIYDPLYYADTNSYERKVDVVSRASSAYSREAAAYQALQDSAMAQEVTPVFYGTWTAEIETRVSTSDSLKLHKRHVRFILMERLDGYRMYDLNSADFREPVRSLILKKVLEAEAPINQAGVYHGDFYCRNIIITVSSNFDDPDVAIEHIQVKVKILDFEWSDVYNHPQSLCYNDDRQTEVLDPRLPSPIVEYYRREDDFLALGWCPSEDVDVAQWLLKHFHQDPRYRPVVWDLNKSMSRPRHEGEEDWREGLGSDISHLDSCDPQSLQCTQPDWFRSCVFGC